MPVIRTVPKRKTKVRVKPKAARGGINALLEKLKFANTPKERAMYLQRLNKIQAQFKKSGKRAA